MNGEIAIIQPRVSPKEAAAILGALASYANAGRVSFADARRCLPAIFAAVGVSADDSSEAIKAGVKRLFDNALRCGVGHALGLTQVLRTVAQQQPANVQEDETIVWARQLAGHLDGEDPEQVVSELVRERIGKPLPPSLHPAADAMARGTFHAPRKRGRPSSSDKRDAAIVLSVLALRLYGFKVTRNPASVVEESACSIVAGFVGAPAEDGVREVLRKAEGRRQKAG